MKPKEENKPNKRKMYTNENLLKALDAVKKGMSKKLASKTYNVPRGTIQSRLRKTCKDLPGPRPILSTEEEGVLVQWVVDCCRKGFPKRKSDLQLSVANFLKKSGRENPFKDDIPGKKWYDLFMRRHPELSERTAEAVTSASANVSEQDIKGWFHKIELYLKENNYFDILQDPARVFNGDESNFQLCPKNGKVISLRGERDVYEVDHATAKTALTVLFTFCANGDVTPPLVVFPNKRLPKDITSSVPDEWGIGLSDTGWMKSELFYDYIKNVFHPYLYKKKVTFPVILFVDGHKTHLSLEVSELCSKLQIVLIALYPNATRILQPADVSAFRPLKAAWKESVLKWRRDHPLETLTKNNFVPVLKEALEVGIKDTTVINGFRTTGLCPWNSDAINYNKCLGKGSKHDEEPKEDNLKLQDNSNKEKIMTRETLENIVGQEKVTFLQKTPLENLTETERILKKICCFFENQETDTSTTKETHIEIENFEAVEFQDIDQLPVILAEDFIDDMQAMTPSITNEQCYNNTEDCLGSSQLVCLDSQQYLLTPVKLQDVLVVEKTPERKGVKNVERSSFVLTSAEWQKTENDKLKAKKLKEEEQETRKKKRLLKQDEKNKTKETTSNKINKKAKGTIKTKKQETEANLIQETKVNKTKVETTKNKMNKKAKEAIDTKKQETEANNIQGTKENKSQENFINFHQTFKHEVMIHNTNIPSSPENEHSFNIKKRKAEEQSMYPPNKRIQVLSDIKFNAQPTTSQVGQRDNNQIDPLEKIINNKRKKTYSLQELEKILTED